MVNSLPSFQARPGCLLSRPIGLHVWAPCMGTILKLLLYWLALRKEEENMQAFKMCSLLLDWAPCEAQCLIFRIFPWVSRGWWGLRVSQPHFRVILFSFANIFGMILNLTEKIWSQTKYRTHVCGYTEHRRVVLMVTHTETALKFARFQAEKTMINSLYQGLKTLVKNNNTTYFILKRISVFFIYHFGN